MDGPLVERMQGFGETVFATMTQLALRYDGVNLGQGFPDTDGPAEVLEAARRAITEGHNQYPPLPGVPALRQAVVDHQRRFYDQQLDAGTEVLVTVGATEAISSSVLALVEPGDEVVTFEPYYDSYAATVALAGGRLVTVPLTTPDLTIDPERLAAAFSDRTRAVLLNSPHNPLGKVFTRAELELVADLARRHDVWVISDEVYEHITFDGRRHVPIATLPGMAERTLTISSAGKTFSVTGWKIGWVVGPAHLVAAVTTVKQFTTFTVATPLQHAAAAGLALGDEVYADLAASLQGKRDLLVDGLRAAGLEVEPPQGTYFVTADVAPLGVTDGVDFCLQLPEKVGVAAVPVSAFCQDPETARTVVRFAFCKQDEVLREGVRRLARVPEIWGR